MRGDNRRSDVTFPELIWVSLLLLLVCVLLPPLPLFIMLLILLLRLCVVCLQDLSFAYPLRLSCAWPLRLFFACLPRLSCACLLRLSCAYRLLPFIFSIRLRLFWFSLIRLFCVFLHLFCDGLLPPLLSGDALNFPFVFFLLPCATAFLLLVASCQHRLCVSCLLQLFAFLRVSCDLLLRVFFWPLHHVFSVLRLLLFAVVFLLLLTFVDRPLVFYELRLPHVSFVSVHLLPNVFFRPLHFTCVYALLRQLFDDCRLRSAFSCRLLRAAVCERVLLFQMLPLLYGISSRLLTAFSIGHPRYASALSGLLQLLSFDVLRLFSPRLVAVYLTVAVLLHERGLTVPLRACDSSLDCLFLFGNQLLPSRDDDFLILTLSSLLLHGFYSALSPVFLRSPWVKSL